MADKKLIEIGEAVQIVAALCLKQAAALGIGGAGGVKLVAINHLGGVARGKAESIGIQFRRVVCGEAGQVGHVLRKIGEAVGKVIIGPAFPLLGEQKSPVSIGIEIQTGQR